LLKRTSDVRGVIQLVDYFEQPDSFILVMERPQRVKDLFDHITESGSLEEDEARCLFRQIVKTTIALHDVGIVHRDIKDENILVDVESRDIRLIDFGSGTFLHDGVYNDFEGEQSLLINLQFSVSGAHVARNLFCRGIKLYYSLWNKFINFCDVIVLHKMFTWPDFGRV